MIRILHVIRPAEGGMKEHLLSLAGGLRDKGCTVEVACPGNTALAAELDKMGIRVHPVTLTGPLNPGKDVTCVSELKQIMQQGHYDVIHCHGSKAGLVGRVAAILAGCKNTVMTVHNFVIYEEIPMLKKVVFRYGEKMLSHFTSRIITVSEALKGDLISNYQVNSLKIVPVYNGIDLAKYRTATDKLKVRQAYGVDADTVVVGTVARMAPQKGLNFLIEAMPQIYRSASASGQDVLFVIAGDGPLKEALEQLAVQKGIREKCLFPGYIEDVAGFLACLDIFVVPSIAEGLSITTIEAMAAGLPVVASRVGGLPELVNDGVTGLLVEPRNPENLANAISTLIADREARLSYGLHGKKSAGEKFSTGEMIEKTLQVYRDILAG